VLVADPSRNPQPGALPPGRPGAPQVPAADATRPAVLSGLSAVTGSKPRPQPLDPPMVPFAVAGLAAFALAGLFGLVFRDWLADHGHTGWLWTCLAGFVIGIPGLAIMIRHDRDRRARRALTHPEVREL
jgi:hypothetical protein